MKTKLLRSSKPIVSILLVLVLMITTLVTGAIASSTSSSYGTTTKSAVKSDDTKLSAKSADTSSTKKSAASTKKVKNRTGAANVYGISGSFNSWTTTANFNSSGVYTVDLAANTSYTFKVISTYSGTAWYGASKTYTGSDNEYYFNTNNSNNATLTSTYAGTYTFTLKREDNSDGAVAIGVTYPTSGSGGGSSGGGDLSSAPGLWIYGNINGATNWTASSGGKALTAVSYDGTYYYYKYSFNANQAHYFRFTNDEGKSFNPQNNSSNVTVSNNATSMSGTWKDGQDGSQNQAFTISSSAGKKTLWVKYKSDKSSVSCWYSAPTYYLTGYVNGTDTTGTSYAFTNTSGDTYTYTLASTRSTQYVTVRDTNSNAFHPATHASGSGVAAAIQNCDRSPGNDNKWFVSGASGKNVKFTWNAATGVLSWEIGNSNVTVYAKDGAAPIDWDNKTHAGATGLSGYNSKYLYNFAAIAKTSMTLDDGSAISGKSTVVCDINNASAYYYDSEYETASIEAGTKIKLTTTITNYNSWRSKYYVKGWCINGVTYKSGDNVKGANTGTSDGTNGVYTMYYTIPANSAANTKFEITPIYYFTDSSNCITFYLEGFDDKMQNEAGWGNTPYAFPFYGDIYGYQDSFGVYPGQPMVYVDGKYSMDIPINSKAIYSTTNDGTKIKGVTVSNGYADHVHKNLIYGWTTGTDVGDDNKHMQTYDFDDFYKIYNEKRDSQGNKPNSIIMRLKRETTAYNRNLYGDANNGINWSYSKSNPNSSLTYSDVTTIAGSSRNGWELLTDRYGRPVDLFGNVISTSYSASDEQSKPAIRVISTGYNETISGDYGTGWLIYTPSSSSGYTTAVTNADGTSAGYRSTSSGYTLQTAASNRKAVPPSIFLLSSADSFSTTTYPGVSNRTFDGVTYSDQITNYKTLYTNLKTSGTSGSNAVGRYVYITYEKNAQRMGKNASTSGDYGAYRMDARWYYTYATDMVSANIKIQYWNGSAYVDESSYTSGYNSKTNKGSHTSCQAYFTNSSFDGERESGDVLINSGNFEFTAKSAAGWVFDSWQIEYDGGTYTELSDKATASTPMSAKDTLVARFKPVTSGYLNLSHNLSSDSTGSGTTQIRVEFYSSDAKTDLLYDSGISEDDVTLDSDYITNALKDAYIQVTLITAPTGDDNFVNMTCSKSAQFGGVTTKTGSNPYTFGFKVSTLFNSGGTSQNVLSVEYFSKITIQNHYYTFTYTYPKRGSTTNNGSFKVDGTFTSKEYEKYVSGDHVLSGAFVKAKAPFESNFNKNMTLNYSTTYSKASAYNTSTYRFTVSVNYTQEDDVDSYAIFDLPYSYYTAAGTASGVSYKKYTAKAEGSGTNQGKILESEDEPTVEIDTQYGRFFTSTATYNEDRAKKIIDPADVNHTGNDFITAPEQIYSSDGSTVKYFAYWSVNNVNNTEELFKIYYPDFNYRSYGNYYIIPVYSDDEADFWHNNYSDGGDTSSASILYLGSTRNQWNSSTSQTTDSQATAADLIYNDFMLSYNYKGQEVSSSSSVSDCGMIIEAVPTTKGGSTVAQGDASTPDTALYKAQYDSTIPDASTLNGIVNSGSSGKYIRVNSADGTNSIKSKLNDKNRIEFNYSFYSQYGQSGYLFKNNSNVDNYVFRAYAYIKDSSGTITYSSPAYFCMRYTANR